MNHHPLTHPDPQQQPPIESISFRIYSWIYPANEHLARTSQLAILNCIPPNPSVWSMRSGFVNIGSAPEILINTLIIEPIATTLPTKPPVLFLHGYGAGLALWYRTLGPIADSLVPKGHSLYAIDWLGMARSQRVPFPKDFDVSLDNPRPLGVQEAEDYFIHALDKWCTLVFGHDTCPKVILVGHSLGGYLAATFALRYPNRVAQLILVSPVGIPPPPPSHIYQRQLPIHWQAARKLFHILWTYNYTPFSLMRGLGPLGPKLMGLYTSRRFAVSIPSKYEQDLVRDYLFHANNCGQAAGEYALSSLLHSGAWAKDPIGPKLSSIWDIIPVRFIYGTVDWMDYMHAVRLLLSTNSPTENASVHLVEQAGHQVFIDNPQLFNNVLIDSIVSDRPTVGVLSRVDMEAIHVG